MEGQATNLKLQAKISTRELILCSSYFLQLSQMFEANVFIIQSPLLVPWWSSPCNINHQVDLSTTSNTCTHMTTCFFSDWHVSFGSYLISTKGDAPCGHTRKRVFIVRILLLCLIFPFFIVIYLPKGLGFYPLSVKLRLHVLYKRIKQKWTRLLLSEKTRIKMGKPSDVWQTLSEFFRSKQNLVTLFFFYMLLQYLNLFRLEAFPKNLLLGVNFFVYWTGDLTFFVVINAKDI